MDTNKDGKIQDTEFLLFVANLMKMIDSKTPV